MREILFRGKRHNDMWAYGSLIHADTYCCILESEYAVHPMDYPYLDDDLGTFDGKATPVNPETIGQYTGLVDVNGTKIFEGDIVKDIYDGDLEQVEYQYGMFLRCNYDTCYRTPFSPASYQYCEVVGNIHDNPKLMK